MEDSCFRYGGDEFCMILPNCRKAQAQDIYIARLSQEIQKHEENISLSIGVVQTGPNEYAEPDALIQEADKKMYAVKKEMKSTKTTNESDPLENS